MNAQQMLRLKTLLEVRQRDLRLSIEHTGNTHEEWSRSPIPWNKLPAGLRRSHCSKEAAESRSCFGQSIRRLVAFETGLTGSACLAAKKLMEAD